MSSREDGPCQTCGQSYPAWRADDALWNFVMGGPKAKDDPGGMLCPLCFLRLADERKPVRGAWVVGTPVRPEQAVKAEALREAADSFREHRDWAYPYLVECTVWLQRRADSIEGGAS